MVSDPKGTGVCLIMLPIWGELVLIETATSVEIRRRQLLVETWNKSLPLEEVEVTDYPPHFSTAKFAARGDHHRFLSGNSDHGFALFSSKVELC